MLEGFGPPDRNPLIGPHEGRELQLMLAGEKPMAMLYSPKEIEAFRPYIEEGRFVAQPSRGARSERVDGLYVALPHAAYRMTLMEEIYTSVRAKGYMSAADHIAIGLFLGYTEEAIESFLARWRYFIQPSAAQGEENA